MQTFPARKSQSPRPTSATILRATLLAAAMVLPPLASSMQASMVNLLSANRYVTVSGSAGGSGGSTTYSDSRNAIQFQVFSDTVTGSANWPNPPAPPQQNSRANSTATQSSTLGTAQFSISQHVDFSTVTPLAGGGSVMAMATSSFQVSFTVSQATPFAVMLSASHFETFPGQYSFMFRLASASSTVDFNPVVGTYSGTLVAGEIYTLTATQGLFNGIPDPLGQSGFADSMLSMNFYSPVPEPSSVVGVLLLIGLVVSSRWKPWVRASCR